jgi:hypothetical protein
MFKIEDLKKRERLPVSNTSYEQIEQIELRGKINTVTCKHALNRPFIAINAIFTNMPTPYI